jgi:hypothetical protein
MKVLMFIAILALIQNAFAAPKTKNEKTVIVAERNTHMGIEQVGVSVENAKIIAISNTNILNKEFPYFFGKFESQADVGLKREIEGLIHKEALKVEVYPSVHDMNIFINGARIPVNDKRFDQALLVIQNVFKLSNLALREGVVIRSSEELEKILCSKKEKICKFKFGYIHE